MWDSAGNDFGAEVAGLAAALSGYGLGASDRAAVLGAEGRGTLRAGLAVVAAGATLVPLDPSISDDALRRVLSSTGAVQAIASDERQLSRILAFRPDLPALQLVLLGSAMPSERKPAALLVEAAIHVGAASLADDPDILRRAHVDGEDAVTCLIVDVAGEARPLSRIALAAMADEIAGSVGIGPGKSLLVALPVGAAERVAAALAAFNSGATVLLADTVERPDAGLEARPADALLLDVSSLERLHRAWTEDIESKSWLGRGLTRWALGHGRHVSPQGWKHRAAEMIALRGLRDKLGGRATRLDVIAQPGCGASAAVDTLFLAAGLTLRYFSPGSTC